MSNDYLIARIVLIGICSQFAGCFGGDTISCEDPALYGTSQTVQPVRVPAGLDVPDESDALQIPPGDPLVVQDVETMTDCLETPPDFFEEGDVDTLPQ